MTARALTSLGLIVLAACPSEGPKVAPDSAPPSVAPTALTREAAAATESPSAAAPPKASAQTEQSSSGIWSFDADKAGAPPSGFSFGRTGSGAQGNWAVKAEADAPSKPNVLAQLDSDRTDDRFPVAVAVAPSLRDVKLSVRCKPVAGSVDQACGLVFRYRDENNYYLTRANALENNVRLYVVKDGRRQQIAGWNGSVTSKAWHELAVVAKDDHLVVSWDGKQVLDHHDKTFSEAGRVGIWTKADSVTYFDDLKASSP
jgi:hypothetical protein